MSVFCAHVIPEQDRYVLDFSEGVGLASCFAALWDFEKREPTRRVFVVEGREAGIGVPGALLADVTSFEALPPGARVVPIVELPEPFCVLARRQSKAAAVCYAVERYLGKK